MKSDKNVMGRWLQYQLLLIFWENYSSIICFLSLHNKHDHLHFNIIFLEKYMV